MLCFISAFSLLQLLIFALCIDKTKLVRASNLPFSTVNILVVTDVHSWVASRSRHEPDYNADYGHVVSFYRTLQQQHPEQDLFFVMNGDFMDGTGLSTYPPEYLTPILLQMPWDALNIGNHELYQNSTVEHIRDHFVDAWDGRYLTSNVLLESTHAPIGSRYRVIHGILSSLLTFGFLYNMTGNCNASIVESVGEVVQSEWFHTALTTETYDAILVLAHMDYQDDLVMVIRNAIRTMVSASIPIQFITGHSHIRAFTAVDDVSTSFEAGHYLDTVGFVSFPISTMDETGTTNKTNQFHHVFINASINAFQRTLDMDSFDTEEGRALSQFIQTTRESMGLFVVLGCSPQTFILDHGLNQSDSLWKFYLDEVVAKQYLKSSTTSIFLQGTGAFRASLWAGEVNVDDLKSVSPYDDTVYLVDTTIEGRILIEFLGGQPNQVAADSLYNALPALVSSLHYLDATEYYHVYTVRFDLTGIVERLENLTDSAITATLQHFDCGTNVTTTSLWTNYIDSQWKCGAEGRNDTIPMKLIVISGAIILTAFLIFFRSNRNHQNIRQGFESVETMNKTLDVII